MHSAQVWYFKLIFRSNILDVLRLFKYAWGEIEIQPTPSHIPRNTAYFLLAIGFQRISLSVPTPPSPRRLPPPHHTVCTSSHHCARPTQVQSIPAVSAVETGGDGGYGGIIFRHQHCRRL